MNYYKVELKSFPKVLFSHTYETSSYNIHFTPLSNFMEISYVEQGDVLREFESGKKEECIAPSIIVDFRKEPLVCSCKSSHRHSTVGISVEYDEKPVTPEEIIRCGQTFSKSDFRPMFAILPNCIPADLNSANLEKLFKKIIRACSSWEIGKDIECTGLIMELLAEISKICLHRCLTEQKHNISYGGLSYSRRAMNYIASHIDENISVDEISSHLGISSSYLSSQFKASTGRTIIEYVNFVKLNKVKELICDKGLTLKEAGEAVGFYDEHYLSRVFKKHFGVSAREYKQSILKKEDFEE